MRQELVKSFFTHRGIPSMLRPDHYFDGDGSSQLKHLGEPLAMQTWSAKASAALHGCMDLHHRDNFEGRL